MNPSYPYPVPAGVSGGYGNPLVSGGGGGGGGTPFGPTNAVQYNASGVFGGSSHLTWTDTPGKLALDGVSNQYQFEVLDRTPGTQMSVVATTSTNSVGIEAWNGTATAKSLLLNPRFGGTVATKNIVLDNGGLSAATIPGSANVAAATWFEAALSVGGFLQNLLGVSNTLNNAGAVTFVNNGGAGSTANTVGLALAGHGNGISVDGNNVVTTTNNILDSNGVTTSVVPGTASTTIAQWYEPLLATSNFVATQLGAANTANNSAFFLFANTGGTGSTSNQLQIGVNGHPASFNIAGTGRISTPNTVLDDGAGAIVQNLTGSASTAAIESLEASLSGGNFMKWILGAATSATNAAFMQFTNTGGTGSTSNSVSIGVQGNSGLVVNGLGKMTVAGSVDVASATSSTVNIGVGVGTTTVLGGHQGGSITVGDGTGGSQPPTFGFVESRGLQGTATLVGGVITVNMPSGTTITATSRIFYCQQSGLLTGTLFLSGRTGSSFIINSTVNSDTAVIAYIIFGA